MSTSDVRVDPPPCPPSIDDAGLLEAISRAQGAFIGERDARAAFQALLDDLLRLTASELGFIGTVEHPPGGAPVVRMLAVARLVAPEGERAAGGPGAFVFGAGGVVGGTDGPFASAIASRRPVAANGEQVAAIAHALPQGHPAVTTLLALPIVAGDHLVALAGLANRPCGYEPAVVEGLRPLITAVAQIQGAALLERRRKVLEEALAQSEISARELVHQLPVGIVTHRDGRVAYANPALRVLLGARADDDLVGRVLLDFAAPASRLRILARLTEVYAKGSFLAPEEVQLVTESGALVDVEVTGIAVEAAGDRWIHAAIVDVTRRKSIERELQATAASLRGILDYAPLGIWLLNDSGRMEFVNRSFCELVGVEESAFLAAPDYSTLLPGGAGSAWRRSDAQAFAEPGAHVSVETVQLPTGKCLSFEIVKARFFDEHGALRLVGLCTDITARLATESRVRLLAAVFDHAREGIALTSLDGTILEANQSYCDITGYPMAELIGENPRLFNSGRHDHAFFRTIFEAVRTSGHWHGEIWNRRKNGVIYPVWASITTLAEVRERKPGYLSVISDISEFKAQQVRLEHLAYHDALTHLPNRTLLADRLKMAQAQAVRSGTSVAVCFLDLDNFKPINDELGHAVGDKLLVEVSTRLTEGVRAGDTVARIGGDEFVLVLVNIRSPEEIDATVSRVLASVAEPVLLEAKEITITASLGVTVFPDDHSDADTLLRHADQALYMAKEAGKNRSYHFDVAHDKQGRARRASLSRFDAALRHGELVLVYQPKVNLGTGAVIGAEALLRWRHPDRGLLSPAQFLPALEGTPTDLVLGEWVIATALSQMAEWRETGLDVPVSVNLSPHHLAQRNFVAGLKRLLAAAPEGLGARLEMELLESAALGEFERVSETMRACRLLGVEFALDDFGTGYSSLTYLKRLPASTLKIDQTFVRDMLEDGDDLAIVEGVIGLARAFRRQVVAEGIETLEHGTRLIELGCLWGQGYFIARPMPPADFPGWVQRWEAPAAWREAAAKLR